MNQKIKFKIMSNRFKILSSETRIKIIYFLYFHMKEATVSDMMDHFSLNQSFLSQQLRILYNAHILKRHKAGINVYYSLANDEIISYIQNIEKNL